MHAFSYRVAGLLLLAGTAAAQPAAPAAKARETIARAEVTKGISTARLEKLGANRGVLTISTEAGLGSGLRLLDATEKEVPVTRTADGALKAEIDPQRGYILKPPPRKRVTLSKEGLHFPARYVTFSPTGATNLGGLFLRPAVVPLTWNEEVRAYSTELFVGYEFADGREITLPVPRTVTFFAEGANARIQADTVTVTQSGGPGYQRVVLSTNQIEGETHFIARVSAVDELKTGVRVLREPGGLKLSLASAELPAFGVGTDVLTVSLFARDGFSFAARTPIEVQLTSRGLRQPPVVTIEPGQSSVRAEVRSTGYGAGEIVAQSGVFRATLPVTLVAPVGAIVASLLGGGIGGVARFLRNRRKGASLFGRRVIEGMLVGLILVGAMWAGLVAVDVSTGVLGTSFGAFVLGALSGYLGCIVLDRVAKKTFGGLKADA